MPSLNGTAASRGTLPERVRLLPLPLWAVIGLIGFSASIAQIVLMRELMVVFYGNEISLGVMLAAWLLWTALGSNFLGKLTVHTHAADRLIAALQLLVALVFPATILLIRLSRQAFHAIPGELLGPIPMLTTCVLALSCFCLVSGCLFTAGSQFYARGVMDSNFTATSSVYLLEACGSAAGGILASLVLIRYLTSIQAGLLVSLLNLLAAAHLAIRRVSYRRISTVPRSSALPQIVMGQ